MMDCGSSRQKPSRIPRVVLIFALLAIVIPSIAQLQPGAPWPKYRGNSGNTGQGIGGGALPILKWNNPSEFVPAYSYRFPIIGADGTVYEPTGGGLAAFDGNTGAGKWSNSLAGAILAIDKNSTLYDCDQAGDTLYALSSSTGATNWSSSFNNYSAFTYVVVANDGNIIAIRQDYYAYGISSSGMQLWKFCPSESYVSQDAVPAIGKDGSVYILGDATLYSLNAGTGAVNWSFSVPTTGGNALELSPVVGPDGTVYVSDGFGNLYAVNYTNGQQEWEVASGATAPEQRLQLGISSGGTLYSINQTADVSAYNSATGTLLWTFTSPYGYSTGYPVISADGTVYISATNGYISPSLIQGPSTRSTPSTAQSCGPIRTPVPNR